MVQLYLVGGAVRDLILGLTSKDYDFAVEADSYEQMREFLISEGFTIFLESPEFFTIRARFPKRPWRFAGKQMAVLTADFVLCRKDGAYTDGRRPDEVHIGTIYDDLARRDFTVNAIAQAGDGEFIDPHLGVLHARHMRLIAVGNAEERLREDALRALRAVRFIITKGFMQDAELMAALRSNWLPPLLASVSVERRREELFRALKHDTVRTMNLLYRLPDAFREAVFADGLWLKPTLEK